MSYEPDFNANEILKKFSQARYEFEQATEQVHKTRKAVDKARKKQDAKIKELERLLPEVYKQSARNAARAKELEKKIICQQKKKQ